jgi:hypothetical protein
LYWLNQQEKWLLVLDNLDDAAVVDGYLSDLSPSRHTLITTRNQYSEHIPAEGLEVELLEIHDAVNLFLTRSRVGAVGETLEGKAEATEIVKELGCLPLASDQATAYIREASKDIFKFTFHARVSRVNQIYSRSIATTWRLSFQEIKENNPDSSK